MVGRAHSSTGGERVRCSHFLLGTENRVARLLLFVPLKHRQRFTLEIEVRKYISNLVIALSMHSSKLEVLVKDGGEATQLCICAARKTKVRKASSSPSLHPRSCWLPVKRRPTAARHWTWYSFPMTGSILAATMISNEKKTRPSSGPGRLARAGLGSSGKKHGAGRQHARPLSTAPGVARPQIIMEPTK